MDLKYISSTLRHGKHHEYVPSLMVILTDRVPAQSSQESWMGWYIAVQLTKLLKSNYSFLRRNLKKYHITHLKFQFFLTCVYITFLAILGCFQSFSDNFNLFHSGLNQFYIIKFMSTNLIPTKWSSTFSHIESHEYLPNNYYYTQIQPERSASPNYPWTSTHMPKACLPKSRLSFQIDLQYEGESSTEVQDNT